MHLQRGSLYRKPQMPRPSLADCPGLGGGRGPLPDGRGDLKSVLCSLILSSQERGNQRADPHGSGAQIRYSDRGTFKP